MLVYAATGSAKNIVPNLLTARSKTLPRKAVDLRVGPTEGEVGYPLPEAFQANPEARGTSARHLAALEKHASTP
jgi:hypothetical protein